MKSVFILYSADCHLSYSSYKVEAITTSKEKAISMITPILKKEAQKSYKDATYDNAKDMVSDLLSNLKYFNQTQTLDTNYVIKEQELNLFDCL